MTEATTTPDVAMKSFVDSIKERDVDQPALVRPHADGGYELAAGHRRQHAAELAGYTNIPCIIRNMTDEQCDDCGIRTQTVDIKYNFVGCIS